MTAVTLVGSLKTEFPPNSALPGSVDAFPKRKSTLKGDLLPLDPQMQ